MGSDLTDALFRLCERARAGDIMNGYGSLFLSIAVVRDEEKPYGGV